MTATVPARSRPPARPASGGDINMGGADRLVSLLGGGALALWGLRRRDPLGMGTALLGGLLALRGATGHSRIYEWSGLAPSAWERETAIQRGWSRARNVERVVTIARPREELCRFFRDFENLPRFMRHVERVTVLSDRRSHWVVRAPAGRTVEWDSEIESERENERIAWRSLAGADIRNAGEVTFRDAPGDRGTEIALLLSYEPPMGPLGRAVAMMFGEEPGQQAADDLRRFKQLMEASEIPTVEGQPSGRA